MRLQGLFGRRAGRKSRGQNGSRRLRFDGLEARCLLSIGPIVPQASLSSGEPLLAELSVQGQVEPAAADPVEQMVSIRIGVWTEDRIGDVDSWAQSQQWPDGWDVLVPEGVRQRLTMPLWLDPRGGYRTILDLTVFTAASEMEVVEKAEQLPFVDHAKLQRDSTFRYGDRTQELIDAITKTGSQEQVSLPVSEPAPGADEPIEILVAFWTPERINDLAALVQEQQWPEALGPVDAEMLKELVSMPLWSDPRGGYRTIARMPVRGDISALEQVGFIDFAKLASESSFRYTPRLQRLIDGISKTGSKEPVYLPLAQSGDVIGLDELRTDPRFPGLDGGGYATAILDTGVDLDHPFFGADSNSDGVADRIVFQYDFADDDADASDQHGHGTHVTSIATSEDVTLAGMAPATDIIHLKVFPDTGFGTWDYVEDGLAWLVNNFETFNIASVNMSLSDQNNYQTSERLYGIDDEIETLVAAGVIVVSASGNDFFQHGSAQGVAYPSADPNSLSVGAVYDANIGGVQYLGGAEAFSTGADRVAPFSQRHAALTTVMAPGAAITAGFLNGGTETMHGTSQAAPHVAGMAVLAQQLADRELGQRLTQDQFVDLLQSTGTEIIDGDDEDDNVTNTGLHFPRLDTLALANAILDLHWEFDAGAQAGDGTPDDFDVERVGDAIRVTVNGSVAETIPLEDVVRITINGSSDEDNVEVFDLGTDFTGNVVVNGGSSTTDRVDIYDTAGNDSLEGSLSDGSATFTMDDGDAYYVSVEGVSWIVTTASAGGNDTAAINDSSGADTFWADDDFAQLTGNGNSVVMWDFESVTATAGGGADTANLYDSRGDDVFKGYEDYGVMIGGAGYQMQNKARFFETIVAHADHGGSDTATLYDSAGGDTFDGRPSYAQMNLFSGSTRRANDFEEVVAYAVNGGSDTATFHGDAGDETFWANPGFSTLSGTGYLLKADSFENIVAYAGTAGGNDTATLLGKTGVTEIFEAWHDRAHMWGVAPNTVYDYWVHDFDSVEARAKSSPSTATLHGTAAYEVFYADATRPRLHNVGVSFSNRASYFDYVLAISNGGGDVAKFYDSSANDTFEMETETGGLKRGKMYIGGALRNEGEGFEYNRAYSTEGGSDTAHLYDSPENDEITATDIEATLAVIAGAWWVKAESFEDVYAHSDAYSGDQEDETTQVYSWLHLDAGWV